MELSVAAARLTTTSTMNTDSHISPSKIPTIPAISYQLLSSATTSGKSPLDQLLANPIHFVKTPITSPIYKRTQAEAFGATMFMPNKKNKKIKKIKKINSLHPLVLMAAGWRGGFRPSFAQSQQPPYHVSAFYSQKEEVEVEKGVSPLRTTSPSPEVAVQSACPKKVVLLSKPEKATKDKTKTSGEDSPCSLLSGNKSTGDEIGQASQRAADASGKGEGVDSRISTLSSPPPEKKLWEDKMAIGPEKPSSEKPSEVAINGCLAVAIKDIPQKRKADVANGANPPAKKAKASPRSEIALLPGVKTRGIANRANDCYRNSVLQLLCSSSVFRSMVSLHDQKSCKFLTCICCSLGKFFENHHYVKSKQPGTANKEVSEIIRMAKVLPKNFRGIRQEDAIEYLHAVLHNCRDQLNKGSKGDQLKDNIIDKTFNGSFPSVLTCPRCHHRSYNRVDHPSLMLQPSVKSWDNKSSKVIRLLDLIDDYLKAEKVDATCEKCKFNQKKFKKQIEIETLPEFLVLNIMRWTGVTMRHGRIGAEKTMCRIDYQQKIKLMEGDKEVEYSLNAVVAHLGTSLSNGHYIAFVKQPDGTWAECDDRNVSQSSWETVARAGGMQATILGYQRVN